MNKKLARELAEQWGIPYSVLGQSLWKRNDHEYQREYRAAYREEHPEETKAQRLKDWQTFAKKHPERWREINRAAARRHLQKKKLLEAQKEKVT